jgi:hypothetical protein
MSASFSTILEAEVAVMWIQPVLQIDCASPFIDHDWAVVPIEEGSYLFLCVGHFGQCV